MMNDISTTQSQPWWKFGHVWLVISGPAIVVVASFFTFYVAAKGMDTVMDESSYPQKTEVAQPLSDNPASLAPAMQARNHAQTGVAPANPKAP
jgi:hypothetical protein